MWLEFSLRKFFLGFNNANKKMQVIDKKAIIPVLKRNGANIGDGCDIESPLTFHNCQNYRNLTIGNHCHIGKDVFFDLKAPIIIEDSVTISMRATILTHFDVGKSPLREYNYKDISKKVIIKKGSYIGANAVILQGITIGECSLVGAGAVVTKDIPSFTIVGGVPAKQIKKISK